MLKDFCLDQVMTVIIHTSSKMSDKLSIFRNAMGFYALTDYYLKKNRISVVDYSENV